MKTTAIMGISICCLTLTNVAQADNFIQQISAPSSQHSAEIRQYLQTISAYQPETTELTKRLHETQRYYAKVHVLKTITKPHCTLDCVPFAEQPALIDKPNVAAAIIPTIKQLTANQFIALEQMGQYFEVNPAVECPYGSVAILRPTKTMLTSAAANQKVAPWSPKTSLAGAGYTWEQGVTSSGGLIYALTKNNFSYFQGPQNLSVPAKTVNHSIDQFWLTTQNGSGTFSVEFGLINSSYFTSAPATTTFIYASVDNYGSNSCYNLLCKNFIQTPNSPAIGGTLSNLAADYIIQVTHQAPTASTSGYYLTLGTNNATKTQLGYYPDSLYASQNLPTSYSTGAEIYGTPGDGSVMGGNYVDPCPEYTGAKVIGINTQNGNSFPRSTATGQAPFNLIWKFGQ